MDGRKEEREREERMCGERRIGEDGKGGEGGGLRRMVDDKPVLYIFIVILILMHSY